MDTSEIKDLPFGPTGDPGSLQLLFSPDGKYLLYCNALQCNLIEFKTGKLINQPKAGTYQWLPDSQGLVGSVGWNPTELIRIDAATGEAKHLMSADGVSLVGQ